MTLNKWATALLALFLGIASASAKEKYAPLPQQIMEAKAVYIDNQSADAHPGDTLYIRLTEWKRFKVVADKKDADLIFVLTEETYQAVTSGTAVTNQVGTTKITSGGPRSYRTGSCTLTVEGARNGATIWANTEPFSRKGATTELMNDFRKRIEAQENPKH
jgi:hypothetical protein